MKGMFDLTNLPVLNSFLKLDLQGLQSAEWTDFPTYGEHKIVQSLRYKARYVPRKEDMVQERTVTTDTLLDVPIDALLIEYARFKKYLAQQKVALLEENTAKEKLLRQNIYLLIHKSIRQESRLTQLKKNLS